MKQTPGVSRSPIDRHALVTRHNVVLTKADVCAPLSIGNGAFCFTADITGLQTFEAEHNSAPDKAIPLATMADWGWHHKPNPNGYSWETFPQFPYISHGRTVNYLYYAHEKCPASYGKAAGWLYGDPNHFHVGRIAMVLKRSDGHPALPADLSAIHQELDLWTGVLKSQFTFEGEPVSVATVCHGERDLIGVTIRSALISDGRLQVMLAFPYASSASTGSGADWSKPEAHHTTMTQNGAARVDFVRTLDSDTYYSAISWYSHCTFVKRSEHELLLGAAGADSMEFVCAFSKTSISSELPDVNQTTASARDMWQTFWSTGGAIDLSQSADPRWQELERRIVLSQYLTRIQSAGTFPPQETGLTTNSWYGKFHLEMYWWHSAHFALWGRRELLERSMPFYEKILPIARKIAKDQGYEGARWPKCVGPEGFPAPSYLEAFLLWQQPHPIYLAELCYRARNDRKTLDTYKEIVFESAKFMASYAWWDSERKVYVIGPPVADAAEIYHQDAATNWNFNFENAYWHFGLEIAQRWRQRLGMARDQHWDRVLTNLSPLTSKDGVYVAGETQTNTWGESGRWSHPDVIGPLGMLDGAMVDHGIMRATLSCVMEKWNWPSAWGWDFPEVAMCAARLGDGQTAIDALLMNTPKNTYLPNGHNQQFENLPLYLPGNGGLLYAVAMMAAGWDGAPMVNAPGFPQDGTWIVRWDGLQPAPADYFHNGDPRSIEQTKVTTQVLDARLDTPQPVAEWPVD
jgi:hypothetical protein